jgi:hypothetical protein
MSAPHFSGPSVVPQDEAHVSDIEKESIPLPDSPSDTFSPKDHLIEVPIEDQDEKPHGELYEKLQGELYECSYKDRV